MPTLTKLSITTPTGASLGGVIYCESAPCGDIPGLTITLTGTGLEQGGTISLTSWGTGTLGAGSGTQVSLYGIFVNQSNMTPGWKTIGYCEPDGVTCSNGISFLLVTANNTLAVDYPNGELYNLDPATGTVYKFKINPATATQGQTLTADGQFSTYIGENGIAFDPTTSNLMITEGGGAIVSFYKNSADAGGVNGSGALSVATYDGEGCASDSLHTLMLYCFTEVGFVPPYGQIAINSPSALAMGPVTTPVGATGIHQENDVFVISQDGTPTLNKLNPNGASNPIPESTLALTGVTPISSLPNLTGGWSEALVNGTSGTLAVADKLAIFANASSMEEVSRATFTTPAYLLVPDPTHGTFIVQLPNLVDLTVASSSFMSIDPIGTNPGAGLKSTSSLFGGLAVSADGSTLYICSGSQCESQPNQ
jgi:hypothetical protein